MFIFSIWNVYFINYNSISCMLYILHIYDIKMNYYITNSMVQFAKFDKQTNNQNAEFLLFTDNIFYGPINLLENDGIHERIQWLKSNILKNNIAKDEITEMISNNYDYLLKKFKEITMDDNIYIFWSDVNWALFLSFVINWIKNCKNIYLSHLNDKEIENITDETFDKLEESEILNYKKIFENIDKNAFLREIDDNWIVKNLQINHYDQLFIEEFEEIWQFEEIDIHNSKIFKIIDSSFKKFNLWFIERRIAHLYDNWLLDISEKKFVKIKNLFKTYKFFVNISE